MTLKFMIQQTLGGPFSRVKKHDAKVSEKTRGDSPK